MSVESFDMTAEVLQTSCSREGWLDAVLERFARDGCAVVLDLLDSDEVRSLREAMYDVRRRIHADIGRERLERAGELGVLRLMMKYDARFIRLLQHPALLDFVDATVSPTAVLHLQNGFILPPYPRDEHPEVFQNHFHQDFPRVLNGYVCSVNVLVTIDAFTEDNGGTLVVPGSQQQSGRPPDSELDRAVAVCCPPGSAIVFDSTLWHAAGRNTSGIDRVGINHQFTRSYFKQQMDLVRALGPDVVEQQVSRTRQLLGWYTRVPTSLDDYYQPPDKRLYRAGQG